MKKYIVLLFLLVSATSYGQFVNYVNINGRYKWIAGKFDSTFTLPSGTTPSLRTGGANAPGALFYSTTDSTVYEYTGSQWRPLHGSDTGRIQIAYVRNTTASPMTTGQVVYINGSTGNVPTVALALNKQDSTSAMTFGFVRGAIPVNGFGWITTYGPIDGINTNAYTEGEVIYLDSIAGQFTHDKPQAPYHMVTLGYIIKKSGNGIIFVKIQNGYELEELHNVKITGPVLNKSVLIYDSVNSLWVDTTVSAAGLGLGGSGTTNYLPKWTGSTALGNSLVYDDGTGVGIGTASPTTNSLLTLKSSSLTNQHSLSLVGWDNTYTGGVILLTNDGTSVNYKISAETTQGIVLKTEGSTFQQTFRFATGASGKILGNSTGLYIRSETSRDLDFGSNNTNSRMIIKSGGNVLIGTTTETSGYRLQVAGNTIIGRSNETAILQIRPNNGYGGWIQITEDVQGDRWTFGVANNSGTLRFGTGSVASNTARVEFFSNGNVGIGVSGTDGGYRLDVSGTFRSTGAAYFATTSGNVGIGTTTPNANAILDLTSTNKGFLPPRMTGQNAENIGAPAAGLLVYINNGNGLTITSIGWWGYDGTNWVKLN